MAIWCVVVLVVLATALAGPVVCWAAGVATCVPGRERAEKPPTTATATRATTTATPPRNTAAPPALKPSWRLGRRLTVLPTPSRLEANGPGVAALRLVGPRESCRHGRPSPAGRAPPIGHGTGASHTTASGGRTISAE